MKNKKIVLCLLLVALCIVSIYGCSSAKELAAEPYTISFEKTSEFAPSSEENAGGGIVIRERKYTYRETNLMILQVENTTDRAYSVTVSGTFYDKTGKELGTASKTFEEFASKHKRYFLFNPEFVFERFEYTVETTKHGGDCPAALLTAEFVGLRQGYAPSFETTAMKTQPTILGGMTIRNYSNVSLDIGIQYLILFDENNEIFSISSSGTAQNIEASGGAVEARYSFHVYQQEDKIKDWPEAIRDHAHGIIVVDGVARSKFN